MWNIGILLYPTPPSHNQQDIRMGGRWKNDIYPYNAVAKGNYHIYIKCECRYQSDNSGNRNP